MKLNRLRNLALGLIFFAFFIMYIGVFFRASHPAVLATLFVLGTLFCLISVVLYFWLGTVSMRIPQVECSNCQRHTKVLGSEDHCMFCGSPVSILDATVRD